MTFFANAGIQFMAFLKNVGNSTFDLRWAIYYTNHWSFYNRYFFFRKDRPPVRELYGVLDMITLIALLFNFFAHYFM